MILVIGAKGGTGTTAMAVAMARSLRGVGLDAADGSLAARLDRPAVSLAQVALLPRGSVQDAVDRVVRKRLTLLWSPECALIAGPVLDFVQAVDERTEVIVDGGIEPPAELAELADGRAGKVVIVSLPDSPVARYHEQRLLTRFPAARIVRKEDGAEEVLRTLGVIPD